MIKRAGIIGYPLSHSISPAFQQAAIDHHKLGARYERWQTPEPEIEKVIKSLRAPSIMGANVTVPYKEKVIPVLDDVDEMARSIGAVNTIVNQAGRLIGHNTDAGGFLKALKNKGGFEPSNKSIVILGAGGSAKAVGFALGKAGARTITLVNRTQSRASSLTSNLNDLLPSLNTIEEDYANLNQIMQENDLVVNCTPLGMKHSQLEGQSPLQGAKIPSHIFVYDLVYNPPETPLLKQAAMAGAQTLGGLPMLIYQGAEAFELWTGLEAPVELMFTAGIEALAASDHK